MPTNFFFFFKSVLLVKLHSIPAWDIDNSDIHSHYIYSPTNLTGYISSPEVVYDSCRKKPKQTRRRKKIQLHICGRLNIEEMEK